jgi:hypothetical protein
LPEWLIERGIGETRYALIEHGDIVEARIGLQGFVPAGTVLEARLLDVGQNGRNAVARDSDGRDYLLAKAPKGISQGAALNIEVVREAIPGSELWKRPLARATDAAAAEAPPLQGRELMFPPAARDPLAEAGWGDLVEQARSGRVGFDGGSLGIFATPAMTLIDVDGWLEPEALAVAGAAAAAGAIRRLGIGGSIGIDLPTASGKAARQAAAAEIDAHLPQPFERTAVNGFGFVQIVRPRLRPSLIEIWSDRAAAEARALLRVAGLSAAGAKCVTAHPAVVAVLESRPDWLGQLARQVGGEVRLRAEPRLPISGGHAE